MTAPTSSTTTNVSHSPQPKGPPRRNNNNKRNLRRNPPFWHDGLLVVIGMACLCCWCNPLLHGSHAFLFSSSSSFSSFSSSHGSLACRRRLNHGIVHGEAGSQTTTTRQRRRRIRNEDCSPLWFHTATTVPIPTTTCDLFRDDQHDDKSNKKHPFISSSNYNDEGAANRPAQDQRLVLLEQPVVSLSSEEITSMATFVVQELGWLWLRKRQQQQQLQPLNDTGWRDLRPWSNQTLLNPEQEETVRQPPPRRMTRRNGTTPSPMASTHDRDTPTTIPAWDSSEWMTAPPPSAAMLQAPEVTEAHWTADWLHCTIFLAPATKKGARLGKQWTSKKKQSIPMVYVPTQEERRFHRAMRRHIFPTPPKNNHNDNPQSISPPPPPPTPLFAPHQPLHVSLTFRYRRPNGHYVQSNRSLPLKPQYYQSSGKQDPSMGGDVDNLAKMVLDAMKQLAYVDDRQVVSLTSTKTWADQAESVGSTTVVIWALSSLS